MTSFWEWETEEERNKRHADEFKDYADFTNRKVAADNFRTEHTPEEEHPFADWNPIGAIDNLKNVLSSDYSDTVRKSKERLGISDLPTNPAIDAMNYAGEKLKDVPDIIGSPIDRGIKGIAQGEIDRQKRAIDNSPDFDQEGKDRYKADIEDIGGKVGGALGFAGELLNPFSGEVKTIKAGEDLKKYGPNVIDWISHLKNTINPTKADINLKVGDLNDDSFKQLKDPVERKKLFDRTHPSNATEPAEYSNEWVRDRLGEVPDTSSMTKTEYKAYQQRLEDAAQQKIEIERGDGINATIANETEAHNRAVGEHASDMRDIDPDLRDKEVELGIPGSTDLNARSAEYAKSNIRGPQDHALSKLLALLKGEGYDGNYVVPPDVAKNLPFRRGSADNGTMLKELLDDGQLAETDDGFKLIVSRHQNKDVEGVGSPRGGNFYEAGDGYSSGYKQSGNSWNWEGGPDHISGETLFKNPLVIDSGLISNELNNINVSHDKLQYLTEAAKAGEVEEVTNIFKQIASKYTPKGKMLPDEYYQRRAKSLSSAQSREGINSEWHASEMILGDYARANGYDGIIGTYKNGVGFGEGRSISEIMDVRENTSPGKNGFFSIHPEIDSSLNKGEKDFGDLNKTNGKAPDNSNGWEYNKEQDYWFKSDGDPNQLVWKDSNGKYLAQDQNLGTGLKEHKFDTFEDATNHFIKDDHLNINKDTAIDDKSLLEQTGFKSEGDNGAWTLNGDSSTMVWKEDGVWKSWMGLGNPINKASTLDELFHNSDLLKKISSVKDSIKDIGNKGLNFIEEHPDAVRGTIKDTGIGAISSGVESQQEGDSPDVIAQKMAVGAFKGASQKTLMSQASKISMLPESVKELVMKQMDNPSWKSDAIFMGRNNSKSKVEENVEGLIYSSYLSDPNSIGSAVVGGLVAVPAKLIRDGVSALTRGEAKSTLTDELQAGQLWFQKQSPKVWSEFITQLKDSNNSFMGYQHVTKDIPAAFKMADGLVSSYLYGMDLAYRGHRNARQLGKTGKDAELRIEDVIANPGNYKSIHEAAVRFAKGETLQLPENQAGEITSGAASLINKNPFIAWAAPFSRTAGQFGNKLIEYSPIGLADTALEGAAGKFGKVRTGDDLIAANAKQKLGQGIAMEQSVDRRGSEYGERVGNGAIGSALWIMGGALAANGIMTGKGPTDKNKRAELERQGWRPDSFHIGGTYINNPFANTPQGRSMGIVIDQMESVLYDRKKDETLNEGIMRAYKKFGKTLEDNTILAPISNLLSFATQDFTTSFGNTAGSMASGLVPFSGAMNRISSAADPIMRDIDKDNPLNRTKEIVQNKLPLPKVGRQELPSDLDSSGKPRENPRFGINSIPLLQVGKAKPNQIDSELLRLNTNIGEVPNKIGDHQLSREERNIYQGTAGIAKRTMIGQVMQKDYYKKADDETKSAIIESMNRRANQWGRESVDRSFVKDAELSAFKGDPEKTATAYVHALDVDMQIKALANSKYGKNKTADEVDQLDEDRRKITAFVRVMGASQGKEVFKAKYGNNRFSKAMNSKPNESYKNAVNKLKKGNTGHSFFFGTTIDPEDIDELNVDML